MQSHTYWGFVLLIFTTTGCGSQPSTDQFVKQMKTVESWAATAQMVGNAWLQKDVPRVYAKQTLQTCSIEELKEIHNQLEKAQKPSNGNNTGKN